MAAPAPHRSRRSPALRPRQRARPVATLLGELARSINASLDLDTILQTVAEGARELCRSDLSAIALLDPETGTMVFRHRAGDRFQDGERRVVLPGRGAGGLVLESGKAVRSDDAPHDPRFADDAGYLAAVAGERIVTLMVVPIQIGTRIEGLLYVDNRTARPFSDRDEATLRQLADHAAIALRNAQLLAREQQAREEAEAANRMKDEFLAMLSHELRTPLNAVLGWAVTLRTAKLEDDTAAHALEVIERNARAQSQLIEDLLDISRIATGKLRLDVRLVDLGPVVEAALDAVRPAARAKSIELAAKLDPSAGPVYGDPDRLQQVVWNLLINAIKFTGAGGTIDVSLVRDGDNVQIAIADTGQGIAPDLLPFVFDRFRQADSSSTRSQGGLGIGLALVKNLTELHGGTAEVESPGVGRGATFRIRLPQPDPVVPSMAERSADA
ncbi:MAG: GAF domain-containing sensor histidine kinase [Candidatus Rokuibacteriota bacterium]|nr:MAG: GAF domain-containing sensor histidine kinase [Candidatus Rokubacteria bacterium]